MRNRSLAVALGALALAGAGVVGTVLASREPQSARDSGEPAALPSGEVVLVEAIPFVLDRPFVHEWRAEKPLASAGYLLVLETSPELARPRQTYEPVLFVGEQTAERCNFPENGRYLVVLVPAPLAADGGVALDLGAAPIWFGSLELPERVDAARVARERALARAGGIGPVRRAANAHLRSTRDQAIHAPDRLALDPYLADLIELYSPEEVDLVAQLRR